MSASGTKQTALFGKVTKIITAHRQPASVDDARGFVNAFVRKAPAGKPLDVLVKRPTINGHHIKRQKRKTTG